jgi:hypothetical protein
MEPCGDNIRPARTKANRPKRKDPLSYKNVTSSATIPHARDEYGPAREECGKQRSGLLLMPNLFTALKDNRVVVPIARGVRSSSSQRKTSFSSQTGYQFRARVRSSAFLSCRFLPPSPGESLGFRSDLIPRARSWVAPTVQIGRRCESHSP